MINDWRKPIKMHSEQKNMKKKRIVFYLNLNGYDNTDNSWINKSYLQKIVASKNAPCQYTSAVLFLVADTVELA